MQPQQGSIIDLAELKAQIVKKIGDENSKKAKAPPPAVKSSPAREDGHQQPGLHPNTDIWSNGVLPVLSPQKVWSGVWDRLSPLGANGKVVFSHQSVRNEDDGIKSGVQKEDLTSYDDHRRPVQHPLAEPRVPSKDQSGGAFVEDREEVEQANQISLSTSPLLAPLGIPFCPASVGGARKAPAVASSSGFISYYGSGSLYDIETLKNRMEQIAAVQGLGGVSAECASILNNMLDVYLKKLIRSCVDLVRSRSTRELRMHSAHKQRTQGKLDNGIWPSNHLHMQSTSGTTNISHEHGQQRAISLLDFKVAMELNPQQLGEDWPWLLEKICLHSFEE